MRKLKFLSIVFFLSTFVFAIQAQDKSKNEEIKIKTSAQCEMCKERIEKVLSLEKGIKSAVVDVDTQIVTVVYNPTKTKAEDIRLAISKTGYDADEVKADKKAHGALPGCCQKVE